jgi:hypothetical protein
MSNIRESSTANLRAIYTKIARIAAERNEAYRKALARYDRSPLSASAVAEDNPNATGPNVISLIEAITRKRKKTRSATG